MLGSLSQPSLLLPHGNEKDQVGIFFMCFVSNMAEYSISTSVQEVTHIVEENEISQDVLANTVTSTPEKQKFKYTEPVGLPFLGAC